jgi:hypothetical protein
MGLVSGVGVKTVVTDRDAEGRRRRKKKKEADLESRDSEAVYIVRHSCERAESRGGEKENIDPDHFFDRKPGGRFHDSSLLKRPLSGNSKEADCSYNFALILKTQSRRTIGSIIGTSEYEPHPDLKQRLICFAEILNEASSRYEEGVIRSSPEMKCVRTC